LGQFRQSEGLGQRVGAPSRDQSRRAMRWLEATGVRVPRKSDGEPDVTVAISPLFGLDGEELKTRRDRIPPLQPGASLNLE